ncbi:hypothetical protein F4860DRAFT_454378 [Xylaria cubensis]|nr:hypothetical protein F4860DRAFT_454378 [Xylaria cubensis]
MHDSLLWVSVLIRCYLLFATALIDHYVLIGTARLRRNRYLLPTQAYRIYEKHHYRRKIEPEFIGVFQLSLGQGCEQYLIFAKRLTGSPAIHEGLELSVLPSFVRTTRR